MVAPQGQVLEHSGVEPRDLVFILILVVGSLSVVFMDILKSVLA